MRASFGRAGLPDHCCLLRTATCNLTRHWRFEARPPSARLHDHRRLRAPSKTKRLCENLVVPSFGRADGAVRGCMSAHAAQEGAPPADSSDSQPANQQDTIIQYVVLRRDLYTEMKWPLGSVVAQACHASTAALWSSREEAATRQYCAPGALENMHKVVLEVKGETQLRNLAAKLTEAGVAHKLWVEQPEDFATCLASAPAPKSSVQPHFKKLKLCSF